MSKKKEIADILVKYLPENVAYPIAEMIIENRVVLKITKPRISKLGDYRPPFGRKTHRISINGDQNKYSFLITFLHEMAHLKTWNQSKSLENPHGKLWKTMFRELLEEYLHVFPIDVKTALHNYLGRIKASSCSDENLVKVLSNYDKNPVTYLENVPFGVPFQLPGGKRLIKNEKLRKRFKCKELNTNNIYLVSPVAEVNILHDLNQ